MIGIVIVSHSATAARGVAEIAAEMAPDVPIATAGGDGHGGIGTVPDEIAAAIASADAGDGVVILTDLGSAVMNAEVAVELGEAAAVIADAPLVEGAVAAAVTATDPDADLARVREEAERAGC